MSAGRKRGGWLKTVGYAGLLIVALLSGLQLFDAGRVLTVRAYVRGERLWSRHVHVAGMRGWPRAAEPALTALGLVRPVRVTVEPGVSLQLDPADDVARTILISRASQWEPEVWAAISAPLSPGAVFLDVGAYIGYDTLKAAHVVGDTGLVVAFEPNPTTLVQLRSNIEASGARNVNLQAIAVADKEQELTLYDARATGNSGSSSLSAKNAGGAGTPYRVKARRIDDVVRELGVKRIDVLKADIEGAEVLALTGATETLRRFHPTLVLEVVPEQLANMGTSVAALEALITSLGYNRDRWIDYKNKEYRFVP